MVPRDLNQQLIPDTILAGNLQMVQLHLPTGQANFLDLPENVPARDMPPPDDLQATEKGKRERKGIWYPSVLLTKGQ